MNQLRTTRFVAGFAIALLAAFAIPDVMAQRGGGGGKGGGGGRPGGGGGGGRGASASVYRGGRSAGVSVNRATVNRSSVSVRVGTAGRYGYPGGGYPGSVARYGVRYGYGRPGYPGRYSRYFYPPRVGIYASPWYWGYRSPLYRGFGLSIYASPYYGYYPRYRAGYGSVGVVTGSPSTIVESQPDAAAQPEPNAPPQPNSNDTSGSDAYLHNAEEAFRQGDYEQAARLASHALVDAPDNGQLHLFAAQSLFALGDYESAAAGIHQAASLLPTNQWGYMVENYQQFYRGRAFVEQMDKLNEFIKEHPDAAYAYFVRGYQNGFLGHQEVAVKDLKKAHELESRDELATQLVQRFGGTVAVGSEPAAELPKPGLNSSEVSPAAGATEAAPPAPPKPLPPN